LGDALRDFLDQIRTACSSGLYYVALSSALSIPEICGALESASGEADGKKYAAWFDKNVSLRYSVRGTPTLTGWDVYRFRCRMLHQAVLSIPHSIVSRIIFIEPGMSGIVPHNNKVFDILNIDVRLFIDDLVESALLWLERVEHTPLYKSNLERSVKRYPDGVAPYMGGTPIIA
jgi:hypothetical protein